MATSDRQERRTARQRGAGTREVKSNAFGFSFGAAPLPPRRSTRKTPHRGDVSLSSGQTPSSRTVRPSLRKTPTQQVNKTPVATALTRSAAATNAADTTRRSATAESRIANTTAIQSSGATLTESLRTQGFITPKVIGKRKRGDASVQEALNSGGNAEQTEALEPPELLESGLFPNKNNRDERRAVRKRAQTELTNEREQDEEAVGRAGRTIPDPIVHQESRPKEILPRKRGLRSIRRKQQTKIGSEESAPTSQNTIRENEVDAESAASDDDLSPINLQGKSRKELNTFTPRQVLEAQGGVRSSETASEHENVSLVQKRGRHRKSAGVNNQTIRPQNPKKLPKTSAGGRTRLAEENSTKVPITVYRPTVKPNDSILEDPLGHDPTPSMNAADILAQTMSEVISNYMERFADRVRRESIGQGEKKSVERQKRLLIAFQQVLQDQLFSTSSIANTGTVLAFRLRKIKKEVALLREELIDMKSQRHKVEIEKDNLRTEHMRWKEDTTEQIELRQNAIEIEEAIARDIDEAARAGRLQQDRESSPDVSEMYKAVVGIIENGGTSQRLQSCNLVLQKTIDSLAV